MLAIWVKVKIKAAMRDKFLKAIEADALGSERDEPGCLRFNVLQDEKRERVLLLRGLQGPGRAGGAPQHAALRDLAWGRRRAGGAHRAHPLQARLPGGPPYWGKV